MLAAKIVKTDILWKKIIKIRSNYKYSIFITSDSDTDILDQKQATQLPFWFKIFLV